MLAAFLITAYAALTVAGMAILRRYRRAAPFFWFQAVMALMAIGTFPLVDGAYPSDMLYCFVLFLAHFVFLITTLASIRAYQIYPAFVAFSERVISPLRRNEMRLVWAMLIFSAAVTAYYYYRIGYNVTLLVLSGENTENYSQLRLSTYSGDEYFAPGYVNQFKNILLPLCSWIIAYELKRRASKLKLWLVSLALILGNLFALTGTGQRGFLFYTFGALIFGFFLHSIGRQARINKRVLIFALAILIPVFAIMTGFYRDVDGSGGIFGAMLDRITSVQQEGALVGFQYIYATPIVWFQDLWASIVGIWPGMEGSTIAHDIHGYFYGSDVGTVPLSPAGSAYYNGGILGVVLIFIGLGVLYTYLYRRFLIGPRNVLRSYTYGFVFFYPSLYAGDTPVSLIDNGVLTLLIFSRLATWARAQSHERPTHNLVSVPA